MSVVKFKARPKRLECSGCGAEGTGSCECGLPYVAAGERAAAAVAANPEKSARVIAEEIGVNHATVSRARKKSTVADATVGKDGKKRKQPKTRKSKLHVVPDEPVARANALQRDLCSIHNDFVSRFELWVKSNPPDEAKTVLYQALQLCAEELLRLASDIL